MIIRVQDKPKASAMEAQLDADIKTSSAQKRSSKTAHVATQKDGWMRWMDIDDLEPFMHELAMLADLCELNLDHNQLKTLPSDMSGLSRHPLAPLRPWH